MIKVNRSTTHHQEHKSTLSGRALQEVIAKAVAAVAGVDLDQAGVTWRVNVSTKNATGTAGIEYYADITIIEDLAARPTEAPAREEFSFSGSVRSPIMAGQVIEWWEGGVRFQGKVFHSEDSPIDLHVQISHAGDGSEVGDTTSVEAIIMAANPDSLRIIG